MIINSNDGWQKVEFFKQKSLTINEELFFCLKVHFTFSFWNREEVLNDDFNEVKIDKTINFDQIIVKENNWDNLVELINIWLKEKESLKYSLYDLSGEYFEFEIVEESEELMVNKEKPLLLIKVKDSRLKFEFKLIIDSTSFNIKTEGQQAQREIK